MRLVSLAVLITLLPSVAASQDGSVYLQVGPVLDIFATSGVDEDPFALGGPNVSYTWNDLNGDRRFQPGEEGAAVASFGYVPQRAVTRSAPGISATVGVFLSPSISIRLDGSVLGKHSSTDSYTSPGESLTLELRRATSITDVGVSAAWHQGRDRRASITYSGGVVFRRQSDELTQTLRFPASFQPSTFAQIHDDAATTTYGAGAMAAIDVAVKLSSHLSVVPQLRMMAVGGSWNVRPSILGRWIP